MLFYDEGFRVRGVRILAETLDGQGKGFFKLGSIHPHLCGRLCRLEMLRRFFRRTREDGDVLFATSAWLADYILERFPAEGPASA